MPSLDWLVIRTSATAGLMLVIPAAIVSAIVLDGRRSGFWALIFAIITLVGFIVAGFGAGRLRTDTPMSHGAVAALVCYVVVQAFGTIRRLVAGDDVNVASYPLIALVAITCGIGGALFADWTRRRALRGQAGR